MSLEELEKQIKDLKILFSDKVNQWANEKHLLKERINTLEHVQRKFINYDLKKAKYYDNDELLYLSEGLLSMLDSKSAQLSPREAPRFLYLYCWNCREGDNPKSMELTGFGQDGLLQFECLECGCNIIVEGKDSDGRLSTKKKRKQKWKKIHKHLKEIKENPTKEIFKL